MEDIFGSFLDAGTAAKKELEAAADLAQTVEELSRRRLGRITGSRVKVVNFREVRAEGKNKADKLKWLDDMGYTYKLKVLAEKLGKDDVEKLTVKEIDQVYYTVPGQTVLTEGAQTYLDELLHEVMSQQSKPSGSSRATEWGHLYEPESMERYKERLLQDNPNYRFEQGVFFRHPTNPLVGATPDMVVFDPAVSETVPVIVVENKCPFNGSHHAAYLRKDEIENRYEDQVLLETLVTGAKEVHFVSYDPRLKHTGFEHLSQLQLIFTKEDLKDQLAELEARLDAFCDHYRAVCRKYDIDIDDYMNRLDDGEI